MGKIQTVLISGCFLIFALCLIFFIISLNKYNEILKNQNAICEQCKQTIFRCNILESQYKEILEIMPETNQGLYIDRHQDVDKTNVEKTLKDILNAR